MQLQVQGIVCPDKQSTGLRNNDTDPFTKLLTKFPLVTQASFSDQPLKHTVMHHIETTGPAVHGRTRRLAPEHLGRSLTTCFSWGPFTPPLPVGQHRSNAPPGTAYSLITSPSLAHSHSSQSDTHLLSQGIWITPPNLLLTFIKSETLTTLSRFPISAVHLSDPVPAMDFQVMDFQVMDFQVMAAAQAEDPHIHKLHDNSTLQLQRVPLTLSDSGTLLCNVSIRCAASCRNNRFSPICLRHSTFPFSSQCSSSLWPGVNKDVR
jgi:hypothetical protein